MREVKDIKVGKLNKATCCRAFRVEKFWKKTKWQCGCRMKTFQWDSHRLQVMCVQWDNWGREEEMS